MATVELPHPIEAVDHGEEPFSPTAAQEARIFLRLRWRTAANIAHEFLQRARLRAVAFLTLSFLFWVILFMLFMEGFMLLQTSLANPAFRNQIIHGVFNAFFFTLLVMITASASIVLYGGLYRSQEVELLMHLPVRAERIVAHKFQEAVLVSSWGFLLLGTPLLVAYGITVNAPWQYFALLIPFMFGFVLVPTGLGAVCCLLLVRWFPRVPRRWLGTATAIVGMTLLVAIVYFAAAPARDLLTPKWLQDMLARLRFSEHRLLPNWWLSTGMLTAAHHGQADAKSGWSDCLGLLGVLWANALLLQIVLSATAKRIFRSSYHRVYGISSSRTATRKHWMDVAARGGLAFLPRSFQEIIVKDLRTFRRDPTLWAQLAVFVGLLALYLINLRRLDYGPQSGQWVMSIGFLNVGVVGLIYSTFATRFILPLLSLEGRSFWVPGTSPIPRDVLLWSKFLLATLIAIPPCLVLVLASDYSLRILDRSVMAVMIHAVTMIGLITTLSALAVGYGARFPSLRDNAPSRIAAGFGGTLNLVVSCVVIFLIATSVGVPAYYWCELRQGGDGFVMSWEWWPSYLAFGSFRCLVMGALFAAAVAGIASTLSLRMGLVALRRLEA